MALKLQLLKTQLLFLLQNCLHVHGLGASNNLAKFGRAGIQIALAQSTATPHFEQSKANQRTKLGQISLLKLTKQTKTRGRADNSVEIRRARAHLSGRDGAEDLHSVRPRSRSSPRLGRRPITPPDPEDGSRTDPGFRSWRAEQTRSR